MPKLSARAYISATIYLVNSGAILSKAAEKANQGQGVFWVSSDVQSKVVDALLRLKYVTEVTDYYDTYLTVELETRSFATAEKRLSETKRKALNIVNRYA